MQGTTHISGRIKDLIQLSKLRLSVVVVFSAAMAYLWASERQVDGMTIWLLSIGGFFVTASSNAFNQILERKEDKLMKRTFARPLPGARMKVSEAFLFAGISGILGILTLLQISFLCGLLGIIALLLYVMVYTPMKKVSSLAVIPGAVAGSIPVVIGAVAARGELTTAALLLFTLQFIWQFPHTWTIAWLQNEDYTKAGIKMLPTSHTGSTPAILILVSTFLIIPSCLLLYLYESTGIHVTWILALAGAGLLFLAFTHYRQQSRKTALTLMLSCLGFLPGAFILLVMEKFIW